MVKKISVSYYKLKRFRNDEVLKIIESLSKEIGSSVYLVGGALRNMFIDNNVEEKADWDFTVSHKSLRLGKKVADRLGAFYFILDRNNCTGRVIYHGKTKEYELDFTDHRGRNLKEDLKLRDFTINTLCLDLRYLMSDRKETVIIDHFNALDDIQNKRIRLTSERNFSDDPLRILRGFTFCAKFGFNFEKNTLKLARKSAYRLKKTSPERICEELAKIFSCKNSFRYILEMEKLGVLEIVLPEIASLYGLDQGQFHHLDVWRHSLQTLAELEKFLKHLNRLFSEKQVLRIEKYLNEEISSKRPRIWILKLACILHDIGKPMTRKIGSDGRIHFYTHEKKGSHMAQTIGRRLKLSGKEVSVLKNAVIFHLRAGQLVNRSPSKRAKFRFFRDTKENAAAILLLAIADRRAMRGVLSRKKEFVFLEDEIFKMLKTFFKYTISKQKKKMLLNGNEVMRLLKISPGPMVGMILRMIEEAQALSRVSNKREAENLARDLFKQIKSSENESQGKIFNT